MKNNFIKYIVAIISITLLQGCLVGKVKEFTPAELIWVNPYSVTDTLIFQSDKGVVDSIIFYKAARRDMSVREFPRGFYDVNSIVVNYYFLPGSYHRNVKASDNLIKNDKRFILLSHASPNYVNNFEISFFGILYSGAALKNIESIDEETFFLDGKKATYHVRTRLNNFTFNSDVGIIEYTDVRNIKWRRK